MNYQAHFPEKENGWLLLGRITEYRKDSLYSLSHTFKVLIFFFYITLSDQITLKRIEDHKNKEQFYVISTSLKLNNGREYHGPLLDVLYAPPERTPLLCCCILRFGFTVNPM